MRAYAEYSGQCPRDCKVFSGLTKPCPTHTIGLGYPQMSKTSKLFLITALFATACWGQTQVATASSQSVFTLRGAVINPEQGVPSWPVLAGNTVKAGTSPLTLTFADGSTITLNPGAEGTLELTGRDLPVFRLHKGSASYNLTTRGSVQVMSGGENVAFNSQSGTVGKDGTGLWPPSRTTLGIVGGGAAAGLGFGISAATSGGTGAGAAGGSGSGSGSGSGVGGATNGGPSVSPSK